MLKGIIIDDELKSRESLKILLEEFCGNVAVMELCQNVTEGINAIKKYTPDVVFLDIQMQRETGFDLLNRLDRIDFEVIFTTAHSENAIKAFKFSAVDYLLKPIDIQDLREAINKVEKKTGNSTERVDTLIKNLRSDSGDQYKMALPTTSGLIFIKIKDIYYCELDVGNTHFHMSDGTVHQVSRDIKHFESLLEEYNFFRIHDRYLINMSEIKAYANEKVIMNNDSALELSDKKRDLFLRKYK